MKIDYSSCFSNAVLCTVFFLFGAFVAKAQNFKEGDKLCVQIYDQNGQLKWVPAIYKIEQGNGYHRVKLDNGMQTLVQEQSMEGCCYKCQFPTLDAAAVEEEVLFWMNKFRNDPKTMITEVKAFWPAWSNDLTIVELIDFLNNITRKGMKDWQGNPLHLFNSKEGFATLTRAPGLDKAAREHAKDIALNHPHNPHQGTFPPCAKDPNPVACRMALYGDLGGSYFAENIVMPPIVANMGKAGVFMLMGDHGVANRGHRANFFDAAQLKPSNKTDVESIGATKSFQKVGIGCYYDEKDFTLCCVILFAEQYTSK